VIKFGQFERKIDDLEAQIDAYDFIQKNDSVSAQLDDLVAQDQIEQELKALKEKVA
jgi:phage shock protein A